jgi:hypothetical protein
MEASVGSQSAPSIGPPRRYAVNAIDATYALVRASPRRFRVFLR